MSARINREQKRPVQLARNPSNDGAGLERARNRDRSVDSTTQLPADDPTPDLFHNIKDDKSILALAVAGGCIYAGTQGGKIVVWSLDSYEQCYRVRAHVGSVLALQLSEDETLLCSCAADAIVNVWNPKTMNRLFSVYSSHDVGDVFCIAYSSQLNTVYLGAQNTSIQWCELSRDSKLVPDLARHPSQRDHRFFDSKGPGGVSTPRSVDARDEVQQGGHLLEIDKANYIEYAHNGYVNCMLISTYSKMSVRQARETLVTGGADGVIKLWQLHDGSLLCEATFVTENNLDGQILCMAASENLIYAGRSEGDVNVWDLQTYQCVRRFAAQPSDIMTICFGHGVLFTGGGEGLAQIHERYKCKSAWKAHAALILASTVVEHNGRLYYVTGGNDDCIAVWDLTKLFEASNADSVQTGHEQMVHDLTKLVFYRTISSDPDCSGDCHQAASWLARRFYRFGAAAQLLQTEGNGNPIVFAEFKADRRPAQRILFYGHYDVVPADDGSSKWDSDPFVLDGRNGYLHGRGVSDNKGPILAAMYAAADLVSDQSLHCDVVFILEGEEESGSRGFEASIREHKDLIGSIDWILLANSYWFNDEYPCLTYGLRGVIRASLAVEGGQRDLHSGVDGSHLTHEPLKDLLALVSSIAQADGHIPLPGFYKEVLKPTQAEERRYDALTDFLFEHNSDKDVRDLKSKWQEPSLTVHGFDSSSSGNPTVIPHRASASISIRLVPNQSASQLQQALLQYLENRWEELQSHNKLSISTGLAVDPWLGDPDNNLYRVLERAIVEVWGMNEEDAKGKDTVKGSSAKPSSSRRKSRSTAHSSEKEPGFTSERQHRQLRKPLYIREGGSIPVIRFLEKEFNAPAAQLPCGQASDSAHLVNERLRVLNLYNSRRIFRKVFEQLT